MSLLLALVLGLLSTRAWSDGGVLTFVKTSKSMEDYYYITANSFLYPDSEAMLQLNDTTEVDALVFNAPAPYTHRFYVTKEKLPRLWYDRNEDGKTQSDELSVFLKRDSRGSSQVTEFKLPVAINTVTPVVWVSVIKDTSVISSKTELTFNPILSYYEGTLAIQEKTYPARMFFRSPFPAAYYDNGLVILDTNEDHQFEYKTDLWFTSQGLVWLENRLWTVASVCTANTANVTLSPYKGPAGKLVLTGQGFAELRLEKHAEESADDSLVIPLPLSGTLQQGFILPAGQYTFSWCSVYPVQGSIERYYAFKGIELPSFTNFTLCEGDTLTLPVGGPLNSKIKARKNYLTGYVNLSHDQKYTNAGGMVYLPNGRVKSSWELCDADGKLLRTGNFEFG